MQVMKFYVNGQTISLSEKEVEELVRNAYATKPTKGVRFEVNPEKINRGLFYERRANGVQEWTRQIILHAFKEVDEKNVQYGKTFYTYIPKKTWLCEKVAFLKKVAERDGGHLADGIEQALEWAQRISNGESWSDVCNSPDMAEYYRLVEWTPGKIRRVGGVEKSFTAHSAVHVEKHFFYFLEDKTEDTVPLIIFNK